MIKRIGDDNFTLQCIEDGMLKDNGIKQDLLQGINDVNVIKKAMNGNINYISIDTEECLLKKIGDKDFVYDYIKSCGYQKNRLLNTIGDKELYKKCIDNGIFDNVELARALIDYGDKELMKKNIRNVSMPGVKEVLNAIDDKNFALDCMGDPNRLCHRNTTLLHEYEEEDVYNKDNRRIEDYEKRKNDFEKDLEFSLESARYVLEKYDDVNTKEYVKSYAKLLQPKGARKFVKHDAEMKFKNLVVDIGDEKLLESLNFQNVDSKYIKGLTVGIYNECEELKYRMAKKRSFREKTNLVLQAVKQSKEVVSMEDIEESEEILQNQIYQKEQPDQTKKL